MSQVYLANTRYRYKITSLPTVFCNGRIFKNAIAQEQERHRRTPTNRTAIERVNDGFTQEIERCMAPESPHSKNEGFPPQQHCFVSKTIRFLRRARHNSMPVDVKPCLLSTARAGAIRSPLPVVLTIHKQLWALLASTVAFLSGGDGLRRRSGPD